MQVSASKAENQSRYLTEQIGRVHKYQCGSQSAKRYKIAVPPLRTGQNKTGQNPVSNVQICNETKLDGDFGAGRIGTSSDD